MVPDPSPPPAPPAPPPSPPPNAIFSPTQTAGFVNKPVEFFFTGSNLRPGDNVKWVLQDDPTGCDGPNTTSTSTVGGLNYGTVSFFTEVGTYILCYQFTHIPYLPWEQFPMIQTAIASVDGLPQPYGTAIGCVTDVTLPGINFAFEGLAQAATMQCVWRYIGVTPALYLNDTHLVCQTPSTTTTPGPKRLTVEVVPVGSNIPIGSTIITEFFHFFELSSVAVHTIAPAGAPYNRELSLNLTGQSMMNYGKPTCAFVGIASTYYGPAVSGFGGHTARCVKPEFPSTERGLEGPIAVHFSTAWNANSL